MAKARKGLIFRNQSLSIEEDRLMDTLQPGDPAPAFSAPDQNNNTVATADFAGRKLFVFFYPKANTSG
jgi:peroxiredoxin Q/BCP